MLPHTASLHRHLTSEFFHVFNGTPVDLSTFLIFIVSLERELFCLLKCTGITDLVTLITYVSLQSILRFRVLSHDFDVKLFSHSLRSRGCSLVSIFTILQVEATVKAFPWCLHS